DCLSQAPLLFSGRSRAAISGASRQQRSSEGNVAREESAMSRVHSLVTSAVMLAFITVVPATAVAQKSGGSLTVGLELDIPVFDPSASMAAALMFDTLTSLDEAGEAQPKLALTWSHSEDYKQWTFQLRPGVKFHDGSAFDAKAVKFNIDRQKDPANKCRCAFYISTIKAVEAPAELTVVFILTDPAQNFPKIVATATANNVVQSPAAIAAKGADYNRNPVGTGPFILKSWNAGDRLVLERNPVYWQQGRPYLDRVVLRPLPDSQARFASLEAGESDIVWDDEFDS